MFCSGCFVLSDWTLFLGCFRRMVLDYDSMECILPGSISYSPLFYLPCLLLHVYCPLDCSYVHSVFMLTASPRLFAVQQWTSLKVSSLSGWDGTDHLAEQKRMPDPCVGSWARRVRNNTIMLECSMLDVQRSRCGLYVAVPEILLLMCILQLPGCWNSSGGPVAEYYHRV